MIIRKFIDAENKVQQNASAMSGKKKVRQRQKKKKNENKRN